MISESVTGQLNSEGEIIKKLSFYFMNYFSLGAVQPSNIVVVVVVCPRRACGQLSFTKPSDSATIY